MTHESKTWKVLVLWVVILIPVTWALIYTLVESMNQIAGK
jgi:hypothetical protein